jgi:uroporphyrinogen-III synthase
MNESITLITRPAEEARRLADKLALTGTKTLSEPMLEIYEIPFKYSDNFKNAGAVIFTSPNAIRVVSAHITNKDVPVFVTGEKSGALAKSLGWQQVNIAYGGTKELQLQLQASESIKTGKVLYFSGTHISEEIKIKPGSIQRVEVYEAKARRELSAECLDALDREVIENVLFFSKRTAEIFVNLLKMNGRTDKVFKIRALCIGDSVVKSVEELDWRDVRAAHTPSEDSLLDLLRTP